MKKEETFDLVLKTAAICLFILTITTVPGVISAFINIALATQSSIAIFTGDSPISQSILSTSISTFVTGILKILLYIFVGRNLFNGGSWIKLIFSNNNTKSVEVAGVQNQD